MADNYTFKDFEAELHSVYDYYKVLYLAVKPAVRDELRIDHLENWGNLDAKFHSTLDCFIHLRGAQFTDKTHKAKTAQITRQLRQDFLMLQYL